MVKHYNDFTPDEEDLIDDIVDWEEFTEEQLWAALEEAKNIVGTSWPHEVGATFVDEVSVDISNEVSSALEEVFSDEYLIDNASDTNPHLYSNISDRINSARSLEEIVVICEYLVSRESELSFVESDISKVVRTCYRLYWDKRTVERRGKKHSKLPKIKLSWSSYYLDLHPQLKLESMKKICQIMLERVQSGTHRSEIKKAA